MGAEAWAPLWYLHGKVLRVQDVSRIRVMFDLRFSVYTDRDILIEGVNLRAVPGQLHGQAMHCLIVLLGGRNVVVQVANEDRPDGSRLGRVFLDEKFHTSPVPLIERPQFPYPLMEVGSYFQWLLEHGFREPDVIFHLTGKRR